MKKFKDLVEEQLAIVSEMANIYKKFEKYLPVNIFISTRDSKHNCRIKIQNNYSDNAQPENFFEMSVPDCEITSKEKIIIKTEDIEYLKRFIEINKDILIDYWNYKLDTKRALNALEFNV